MAGVRSGVRTGEAVGVTVTEGMGGDVGIRGARPRGERRLPMVILLGETIVALERSTTPVLPRPVGLGGEDRTERECGWCS